MSFLAIIAKIRKKSEGKQKKAAIKPILLIRKPEFVETNCF